MLILAKVLHAPVPVIAGMTYMTMQDLDTLAPPQGPQWLIGAVAGIWLVLWILERTGKFPSGGIDRRRGPKFEEQDRQAILNTLSQVAQLDQDFRKESDRFKQLHGLLTFRSGEDGIERWLKHHQATMESRAMIEKLVEVTTEVKSLRADEQKRTGVLISTLEANQRALVNIQKQLDELKQA